MLKKILIPAIAVTIIAMISGIYLYLNSTSYLQKKVESCEQSGDIDGLISALEKLSKKNGNTIVAGNASYKLFNYCANYTGDGDKALWALKNGARINDLDCMLTYADMLINGDEMLGVEKDLSEAIKVLREEGEYNYSGYPSNVDHLFTEAKEKLLELYIFHPECINYEEAGKIAGKDSRYNFMGTQGYKKGYERIYPYVKALEYIGEGGFDAAPASGTLRMHVFHDFPGAAVFAGNTTLLENTRGISASKRSQIRVEDAIELYNLALYNEYINHDDILLRLKYLKEFLKDYNYRFGSSDQTVWHHNRPGNWSSFYNSDTKLDYDGDIVGGYPHGRGFAVWYGDAVYVGTLNMGNFDKGIYINKDGAVLTGEWENNSLVKGYITEPDGISTRVVGM
ncbi:MAG: hypothetical protein NC082_00770 [Clostridiales bacterium]|nr:hypothetical protein [Clostridiales bacterium]